jgi:diguanylate cyclase (GGDEF)-like protein
MYLMFDQVAMDAQRYDYAISVLAFRIEGLARLRRQYGALTAGEVVRTVAGYLKNQVRDTDILVRYSEDQFLTLHVKMDRDQAESFKSRIQDELDRRRIAIRQGVDIPLQVSISQAQFPQEGTRLEDLLSTAEWRLGEEQHLRAMAQHTVRFPS